MRTRALCLVLVSASLTVGCNPDLGECDEAAARELVYDECGLPMYAGQALVQSSCGNGSYCHMAEAAGAARNGAPAGLNWDVALANVVDNEVNPEALDRLRHGQRNIFRERDLIWTMVEAEVMPPFGDATDEPLGTRRPFAFGDGRVLEIIETEAARDRVRNWLACGAPVVERSAPIRDGAGAIVPTEVGSVVPPIDTAVAVEPTFMSIYNRIIEVRCARCHRPSSVYFSRNSLDMSSADTAYANLVGMPPPVSAMGVECGASGTSRVVAGEPEMSLLFLKIDDPSCGDRMPLNEAPLCPEEIEAVRQWILDGAMR